MIVPNLSAGTQSAAQICELNQMNMLNGLAKLPSRILWMMLLALGALLIYIYVVPWLKGTTKEIVQYCLTTFAAGSLIFACILQAALTYNITEATWKALETGALVVTGLWLLIYCLTHWDQIKAFLKGLEDKGAGPLI